MYKIFVVFISTRSFAVFAICHWSRSAMRWSIKGGVESEGCQTLQLLQILLSYWQCHGMTGWWGHVTHLWCDVSRCWCVITRANIEHGEQLTPWTLGKLNIVETFKLHQWQITWMSWGSEKPKKRRAKPDTWNLASRLVVSAQEGEIHRKISQKRKCLFEDSRLCLRRV